MTNLYKITNGKLETVNRSSLLNESMLEEWIEGSMPELDYIDDNDVPHYYVDGIPHFYVYCISLKLKGGSKIGQ